MQAQFGTSLDGDGKCMLPSADAVEKRMLATLRKKKEQQRDNAQDSAARVGCAIVSVNSVTTLTLDAVTSALAQAAPSKEQPVRVVLRRPTPQPKSWRGQARSAAHWKPSSDWHPSVVSFFFDELMKDPRRGHYTINNKLHNNNLGWVGNSKTKKTRESKHREKATKLN